MIPTTFVDFVIVALAAPYTVLVISSYVFLAGALIGNARERFKLAALSARAHAPAER
jgi:hypothetical protein